MRTNNREELENKKLALEISELKKRWYKKPANYLPLLTLILTISTILWTCSTGILDIKYQTLTKEKKILELDIKEFETTKSGLIRENNTQHLIADSLKNAINTLKKEKEALSTDVGDILNQYKNESSKVSALIKKIASLNSEYDKRISDTMLKTTDYYMRVMDRKLSQEEDLRQKTWDLQRQIDICKGEYGLLQEQLKALKKDQQ